MSCRFNPATAMRNYTHTDINIYIYIEITRVCLIIMSRVINIFFLRETINIYICICFYLILVI